MPLWPHQIRAIEACRDAVKQGYRAPLLVCPTGGGKSLTGATIAKAAVERGGKVLWLAHRTELIKQACDTLTAQGLRVGAISAAGGVHPNPHAPVQVASVQTLHARKGHRPEASLIICDEFHHFISKTFKGIIEQYPNAIRIGLTATPQRGDGQGLEDVADVLIPVATVRELTAAGFLVPCDVIAPRKALASKEIAQRPLDAYLEHTTGTPSCVVFAPNRVAGQQYTDEFHAAGIRAAFVSDSTPWGERFLTLEKFKRGEIRVVVNVMILTEGWDAPATSVCILARGCGSAGLFLQMCLDEKTEILTRRGWAGIDDLSEDDDVAAVNVSGLKPETHWEKPCTVVRRPLSEEEAMIGMSSPRLDVRMTAQHEVIHRSKTMKGRGRSAWRKSEASVRAAMPGGYEIPSASFQQAPGVPFSDAALRLVGWFLTDGCVNKRNQVLAISQAEGGPFVGEIRRCLDQLGLRYGVNRLIPKNAYPNAQPRLTFSVTAGRPRRLKEQHLKGWMELGLKPLMDKDLSPVLEDMTAEQLEVLLEAMHWGNGHKQDTPGQTWTRRSYHICTCRKLLAERVQSLCLRRGWSCNVSTEHRDAGQTVYIIRAKKTYTRSVGGAASPDRPKLGPVDSRAGERVWCVTVSTGAIIVRRNGKAYITGNCGRVLRASPGKTKATLLDLRGVVHVHGRPDDDREYSLEGQGIRCLGEALPPGSFCVVCGAVVMAGVACSDCGRAASEMEAPRVVNAPLCKFEHLQKDPPGARVARLAKWIGQARDKGHKEGSAYYKYAAVYGSKPTREELTAARAVLAKGAAA